MALEHRLKLLALFHAQRGRCAGCGNMIRQAFGNLDDPLAPSFDHLRPRSVGGTAHIRNGLLKHRSCNGARGDRPPSGCDLIWHSAVQLRLKAATKRARARLAREARAAARREAHEKRLKQDEEGRTVRSWDGSSYRLRGLVRIAARVGRES